MDSVFTTGSTNIVAFLMSKGINPSDTTFVDGQTYFVYARSKNLSDTLKEYDTNQDLKDFISCFRKVKQMIRK